MKISCLIPVFNTPANHLIEAVESIFTQTYSPNEILLINDGSTSAETIEALKLCRKVYGCKVFFGYFH